ncbi:MAG: GtrA family protein [Acidimicrobiales bacterium]
MSEIADFGRRIAERPVFKKLFKYAVGSGVSAVISQIVFVVGFRFFFDSRTSSIVATLAGAVPSYFMNRHWAWQRRTKSSLRSEVIPYLIMAVIGLVFSTWAADFANSHSTFIGASRNLRVLWVDGAYFGSFAVLWVLKFLFLDRVLFRDGSAQGDELIDV